MEGISADWRTSTYSGGNGANCVEVATVMTGVVVRDTTNRAGAVLTIPAAAWCILVAEVRSPHRR